MNFVSSMTGFGKGENSNDKIKFVVEIKTINNRYNDINIKIPKYIRSFEENIRRIIKKSVNRGRIDVLISYEMIKGSDVFVKVNLPVAVAYKEALKQLVDVFGGEEPGIDTYLKFPDILEISKTEENEDEIWETLKIAVDNAISELVDMRNLEGEELRQDIIINIQRIESLISEIEKYSGYVVDEYKDKLEKRITELLSNKFNLDENKLYNEIVFFADRSDINEELVRLNSHLKQLKMTINEGGNIGRKLDFIIQEVNRETNTIASKSSSVDITQNAVEIKNYIEKMREQVQNIE